MILCGFPMSRLIGEPAKPARRRGDWRKPLQRLNLGRLRRADPKDQSFGGMVIRLTQSHRKTLTYGFIPQARTSIKSSHIFMKIHVDIIDETARRRFAATGQPSPRVPRRRRQDRRHGTAKGRSPIRRIFLLPAPAFASLLFFLRHAPTLATERCAAYPKTLTIIHARRWRDAAPQMK